MNYSLGIDIGGTSIKVGVVDENHALVYKDSFPTRSNDGSEAIMGDIKAKCRELVKQFNIVNVGVGCPGDKDNANVSILAAGNLPFHNVPVVSELKEIFDCEVYLDNDANCALIAEWLVGSGKGCKDMVILTIGTGIGGGCIVNGTILRGVNNDAGELGHFVIDPTGPECPCGQKGCFELFASATALINATKKAAEENPGSVLASLAADGVNGATAFEAYRKGCSVAEKVLEEYGKRLATGINGLHYIFTPELISLEGGVTKEGETLLQFVRPFLLFPAEVKISSLGGDAGIIGASLLYKFADYYLSLRK
jgi:glucokinase